MCGIVGYVGFRKALPVLIQGLKRLEYRGYDSAGIAVLKKDNLIVRKKQGKLSVLIDDLKNSPLTGNSGIGHTRWATHGVPSKKNAHPFLDCSEKIAVIHNGIIENHMELKTQLLQENHRFTSDTDTEVLVHLVEKFYKGDLEDAVRESLKLVHGSYAIAVIHADEKNKIVAARCESPLVIGIGNGENFIASDTAALCSSVEFLTSSERILKPSALLFTDSLADFCLSMSE